MMAASTHNNFIPEKKSVLPTKKNEAEAKNVKELDNLISQCIQRLVEEYKTALKWKVFSIEELNKKLPDKKKSTSPTPHHLFKNFHQLTLENSEPLTITENEEINENKVSETSSRFITINNTLSTPYEKKNIPAQYTIDSSWSETSSTARIFNESLSLETSFLGLSELKTKLKEALKQTHSSKKSKMIENEANMHRDILLSPTSKNLLQIQHKKRLFIRTIESKVIVSGSICVCFKKPVKIPKLMAGKHTKWVIPLKYFFEKIKEYNLDCRGFDLTLDNKVIFIQRESSESIKLECTSVALVKTESLLANPILSTSENIGEIKRTCDGESANTFEAMTAEGGAGFSLCTDNPTQAIQDILRGGVDATVKLSENGFFREGRAKKVTLLTAKGKDSSTNIVKEFQKKIGDQSSTTDAATPDTSLAKKINQESSVIPSSIFNLLNASAGPGGNANLNIQIFITKDEKPYIASPPLSGFLTKLPEVTYASSVEKKKTAVPCIEVRPGMENKLPVMRSFAIGNSDFKGVRDKGGIVVDTSLLIKELIDDLTQVKLIIRPRRFGKTFNMSMVKYFFDGINGKDHSYLFNDLKITKDKEYESKYKAFQGKHPVLFITFKDINAKTFDESFGQFVKLFSDMYLEHKEILNSEVFQEPAHRRKYEAIMNSEAKESEINHALKDLIIYLRRCYAAKPIVLIDEYDAPIHASYSNNYLDPMITFLRNVLSSALKDNMEVEQVILTGTLRVAKANIFSGFNNLRVYSMLSEQYSPYFGFSKEEVEKLLKKNRGFLSQLELLENWYGGYRIGEQYVFNPWSIVNFIEDNRIPSKPRLTYKAHWVDTSENKLISDLLEKNKSLLKENFKKLLQNEPILQKINEQTILSDVQQDIKLVWSFLFLHGYLTSEPDIYTNEIVDETEVLRPLIIPNQEIFNFYNKRVASWYQEEKLVFTFFSKRISSEITSNLSCSNNEIAALACS